MASAVTMNDVAKRAGVSNATVSNALNRPDWQKHVSAERAALIRNLAREMGYAPNLAARNLKLRKTHTIAFLIQSGLQYPYVYGLIEGVQKQLIPHGYHLNLELLEDVADPAAVYQSMTPGRCDGVIVQSGDRDEIVEPLNAIRQRGVPLVAIYRRGPAAFDCVDYDRVKAVELGVRHLVSQGHRHIPLVISHGEMQRGSLRLSAYARVCQEAGLSFDPKFIMPWMVEEDALPLWNQIQALQPRPTAIFSVNEEVAMSLMRHILRSGLRIPEDMAVISFGNVPHIRFADVPLTAVGISYKELAAKTVQRLMAQIDHPGSAPQSILTEPELFIRASSQFQRNREDNVNPSM